MGDHHRPGRLGTRLHLLRTAAQLLRRELQHASGRARVADRLVKFRDDIDPANTWVVSDTHFGHENIVGYCARPLDHDQVILEQWRAHVPDDATVLHLGDLCWKSNAWFKNVIAPRLTGERKLL